MVRVLADIISVRTEASWTYDCHIEGDTNIAALGALLSDPGRLRILLVGGDGRFDPEQAREDRLSASGQDVDYRLTDHGAGWLRVFGLGIDAVRAQRRPLVGYCLDWSEQRHHLAGALGAAMARLLFERG